MNTHKQQFISWSQECVGNKNEKAKTGFDSHWGTMMLPFSNGHNSMSFSPLELILGSN